MIPSGFITAPLNHLLAQSDWASRRLQSHSGKTLCIACGPLRSRLQITAAGLFTGSVADQDDVVITLPANVPFLLVSEPQAIFAGANLQGSADITESLAFVFRNLRWDAEADLARFTGDIVAYRLLRAIQAFFSWQTTSLGNLGNNVSEFLVEEAQLSPHTPELRALAADNQLLLGELNQLEARIGKLKAG